MLVRIVIVDDHAIVRAGLATLLEHEQDLVVVGMAADAQEGLHLASVLQPDVALVDYSMPGMSGVELCALLTERHPDVAVILLTTFLQDDVVLAAIDAGARAYVAKDVDARDLKKAIRMVAAGGAVLDPKVTARVAKWAQRRRGAPVGDEFSGREIDILRLVARGATTRDIASQLHLSENTIKTHLRRAMAKLDCHSRSAAAAVAAQRGLL